jgi:hypothetical protein
MAKRRAFHGAFIAGLVLTGPVFAAEADGSSSAPTALACINAGHAYKVGEYACIAACHERRRFARCDAVSDKPSWTYLSDACPSAMINAPWPSDHTELPAVVAMSPVPLVLDHSAIAPDTVLRFTSFEKQTSGGASL